MGCRLQHDLERITAGMAALRMVYNLMGGHQQMSKLADVAERIKAKKLAHEAKADAMAARLDKIDQREPEVFAIAERAIDERMADLAGMEADMRSLSNLAPSPLPPRPEGSPAPSQVGLPPK